VSHEFRTIYWSINRREVGRDHDKEVGSAVVDSLLPFLFVSGHHLTASPSESAVCACFGILIISGDGVQEKRDSPTLKMSVRQANSMKHSSRIRGGEGRHVRSTTAHMRAHRRALGQLVLFRQMPKSRMLTRSGRRFMPSSPANSLYSGT